MSDLIDDRFKEILNEFNRMFRKPKENENIYDKLIRYGLTHEEAKAWIDQEPNFVPSEKFLQPKKSDKDFTEPPKEGLVAFTSMRFQLLERITARLNEFKGKNILFT